MHRTTTTSPNKMDPELHALYERNDATWKRIKRSTLLVVLCICLWRFYYSWVARIYFGLEEHHTSQKRQAEVYHEINCVGAGDETIPTSTLDAIGVHCKTLEQKRFGDVKMQSHTDTFNWITWELDILNYTRICRFDQHGGSTCSRILSTSIDAIVFMENNHIGFLVPLSILTIWLVATITAYVRIRKLRARAALLWNNIFYLKQTNTTGTVTAKNTDQLQTILRHGRHALMMDNNSSSNNKTTRASIIVSQRLLPPPPPSRLTDSGPTLEIEQPLPSSSSTRTEQPQSAAVTGFSAFVQAAREFGVIW